MANPSYYYSTQPYSSSTNENQQSFVPSTSSFNYQGISRADTQQQYRPQSKQNQIQQPVPKSMFLHQHILDQQQQMLQQHWTEQQQLQGTTQEIPISGASKSMGQIPSPYNTPPLSDFGIYNGSVNYHQKSSGKGQTNSFSVSSASPQLHQMVNHSASPQPMMSQHRQMHQNQQNIPNNQNMMINSNNSLNNANMMNNNSNNSNNSNNLQGPKQQDPFHLNLETYKSQACSIKKVHNHKQCHYYHHEKDRKRVGFSYSADICEFIEQDKECPFGDDCPNSHNKVEQLFRPDKYKKKFCVHYPHNLSKCEYGTFCSFAHSENDIKIELIHHYVQNDEFFMYHFKTVWCPFNYINHDKGGCVYAHNWQDFRRRPDQFRYEAVPCPYWKPTEIVQNYDKGCPDGMHCQKCHGWKEYDFFPMIYKTRACDNGKKCIKGNCCPFYHHPESRRIKNNPKTLGGNNQAKADIKELISFSGNFDDELRNMENELFSTKSTIRDTNPAFSGMSFKEDMEKVPRNERRFSFEKEVLGGEQKKYALANEKITDDLFKEILEEATDNNGPYPQYQERPKSRTMPVKFYGSQKHGPHHHQNITTSSHFMSMANQVASYQQGSPMGGQQYSEFHQQNSQSYQKQQQQHQPQQTQHQQQQIQYYSRKY